jgi:hypothetical protein
MTPQELKRWLLPCGYLMTYNQLNIIIIIPDNNIEKYFEIGEYGRH